MAVTPSMPTGERSAATRELMKLTWDYPVYAVTEGPRSEGTTVKAKRSALSLAEAMRAVAGNDPRPLLVVRECSVCNKTDDALLTPGVDNEKIMLYSRWFHCVKLPVDVRQPDHPFNALFPSDDSEHLFVSKVDGSQRIPLESDTSRTELVASMDHVLAATYAAAPSEAVKSILRSLDRIDALHIKLAELTNRKGELMERPSADTAKIKAVQEEIDSVKALVAAQRTAIEEVSKIELRPADQPGASVPAKAGR